MSGGDVGSTAIAASVAGVAVAAAVAVAYRGWARSRKGLHHDDDYSTAGTALPPRALPASLAFIEAEDDNAPSGRDAVALPTADSHASEEAEILDEQLSRNVAFLGVDGQQRLAGSHVAIVGLGAVGSHVAALLGRTGVQRLRLIDPARLRDHSLATSAVANAEDVAARRGKAECVARFLAQVVPHVRVEVINDALSATNAESLLGGVDMAVLCAPTAVRGADGASCPVAVGAAHCQQSSTRCMVVLYEDAAKPWARSVAHQRYSALHDVCCCVQARSLAARLRQLLPDEPPLPCLTTLAVHAGEHSAPHLESLPSSLSALPPDLSAETCAGGAPGTCATYAVLAAMGHAAAAACCTELAGCANVATAGVYSRSNRDDAHRALTRRERDRFGCDAPLDVWPEDLEYLFMEIWGGRCARSGSGAGGDGPKLVFTRWDRTKPAAVGNLILLTKQEAEEHDSASEPFQRLGADFCGAVERALGTAACERQAWAAQRRA